MGSYLDLQNAIATDLTRTDLTSQVKSAILDAVRHYETSRFYFNITRSMTFPTVIGQAAYGSADLAQIPYIIGIDALFLNDTGRPYELEKYEADEFEWLQSTSTGNGRPAAYTFIDSEIRLWPAPVAVYTMRPIMHYRLTELSADGDTNAWTSDAEQLIRCHAKLLLYANVLEDTDGMQRMSAQIQSHKDPLDYKTATRMATGRIRATSF